MFTVYISSFFYMCLKFDFVIIFCNIIGNYYILKHILGFPLRNTKINRNMFLIILIIIQVMKCLWHAAWSLLGLLERIVSFCTDGTLYWIQACESFFFNADTLFTFPLRKPLVIRRGSMALDP